MSFTDLPVPQKNENALAALAEAAAPEGGTGGNYLQYKSRMDVWGLNREAHDVSGEIVVIHPDHFQKGVIGFTPEKKPVKHVKRVGDIPPIRANELDSSMLDGKGWSECLGFIGILMTGEHAGTQFEYVPSTYGGREAVKKVMRGVMDQHNRGSECTFAAVRLESSSYNHDAYGRIHNPELEIVCWVDSEMRTENGADAPWDDEPEEAVVVDEEKPKTAVRRRRRSA